MAIKTQSAQAALAIMQAGGRATGPVVYPAAGRTPLSSPVELFDFGGGESAILAALNKTERRFYEILQARQSRSELSKLRIQAVKLRLASNTHYTPDFSAIVRGRLTFFEIKGGFIREDGWLKLKMAAAAWPEFDFVMCQWDGKSWTETEVKK